MKTTRKAFLSTVAAGLAAASLKPAALLGADAVPADGRAFRDLVGETFRFRAFDRRDPVDLVLAECSEAAARAGTKQFSLTLVAPGGESLREGTYTVDHARTGTFRMFVVPTGRDAKGRTAYRADFNILTAVTGAPATARRR